MVRFVDCEDVLNFKKNESAQKLRGGYYTPPDLAEFLVRWVKEINPAKILEPSCGDGVFFSAINSVGGLKRAEVLGFELNAVEAAKSRNKLEKGTVKSSDFLKWAAARLSDPEKFDAVLGNPPFVRYQYLPSEFQECSAQIFGQLDCGFTKHTNAWVPFILASLALLRPGGRLAMVVPAEIIHVMHAQSLRSYLGRECRRLVIIDPEELWFDGTLQGAVLLLAEKRRAESDKSQGVGIYSVRDREFLKLSPAEVFAAPNAINGKTVAGKWTRALLNPATRSLLDGLEEHEHVHRFNDVASVDVGIVTGANKFFLVDDDTVERYKLHQWAHPMFGRSEHCPGVIYDDRQRQANVKVGNPTNFLWFDQEAPKSANVREYIRSGELEELHTRYKCRIRSPWYTVPSVYSTQIGMLKRSHHMPRLILNKAGAYTTDTAYRIRSKVEAEQLVSSFLNPLTALSAELEGRHYGGGVLELVPSEIEKMLIPICSSIKLDIKKIDQAVRTKPVADVLETNGSAILSGLNVSKADVHTLTAAWDKLRNRRHRVSTETAV
jgi:adenine-specific DNA-methyltransferase